MNNAHFSAIAFDAPISQEDKCTLITRWATALSVPFAMLARASRRPQLALFFNGLQRLVFTAWVYIDGMRAYRYWSLMKKIEEPHKAAKALEVILGSNDDAIARVYSALAPGT